MRLVWVIAQVSESRAQYSPKVLGSVVERNEDAGEVHFIFRKESFLSFLTVLDS